MKSNKMENLRANISAFLRWYMAEGAVTQSQLAALIGIKQGQLSQYLTHKQVPSLELAVQISQNTGFPLDYIIRFSSPGQGNPTEDDVQRVLAYINNSGKMGNVNIAHGDIHINNTVNPRIVRKNEYVPQPGDITSAEASDLKILVDEIADLEQKIKQKPKGHGAVWAALNRKMKVTYYREIKQVDYPKAVAYLRQWRGRLKSTKTFKKDDSSAWRKDRYKAIKTIAKKELSMSDLQLKYYITDAFGTGSLTELKDEELERLYRRLITKKNGHKNDK